ncbi:MAG: hypothetical protein M5U26_19260 [Planctomycetota bacterium]|nr:hypothetical protein [Planctomycetota bacterium]
MKFHPKPQSIRSDDIFWLTAGIFLTGMLAVGSLMFAALAWRRAISPAPVASTPASQDDLARMESELNRHKLLVQEQQARMTSLEERIKDLSPESLAVGDGDAVAVPVLNPPTVAEAAGH